MTIKAIETQYKGYRFRSRLEARWAVFFDALGLSWKYEHEGFDLGKLGWYLPDFYLSDWDCWVEVKPTMPNPVEAAKLSEMARSLNSKRQEYKEHFILCGTPGTPQVRVSDKEQDYFSFGESYAAITVTGALLQEEGQPCELTGQPVMFFAAFALVDGCSNLDIWPMYFKHRLDRSSLPWLLTPVNVVPSAGLPLLTPANRIETSIGSKPTTLWSLSPTLGWTRRHYVGRGVSFNAPQLTKAYDAARSARFEHGETPK